MALRTFKYLSLGGTNVAQPAIGTFISAAVLAGQHVSIAVNDSSMFLAGDYAVIVEVGGTLEERVFVEKIPDATHIQVQSLAFNHVGGAFATGAFVRQGALINSFYLQTKDGNAASLFVGNSINSKNTGVLCVAQLVKVAAAVQPAEYVSTRGGAWNPDSMSEVWVVGTLNDQYLASFTQV